MRVMLDTNVIISALLFPSERMNRLFQTIVVDHTLVISSYVIEELHTVIERKFPQRAADIERLLSGMSASSPLRQMKHQQKSPITKT